MIKRRKTKTVKIGPIRLGSRYAVRIQSMTNVPTRDVDKTLRQIRRLEKAGCEIIRLAVPTRQDSAGFAKIVEKVKTPLVADVHFEKRRAIDAIEAGAAKIRLNPGNIRKKEDVIEIIRAAKMHGTAIRAGVNEASIRDLKNADVPEARRVGHMLAEMRKYVRLFEKEGFENLVLSAKSADAVRTIEINRRLGEVFEYPIHLGLTHAGLPEDAAVPSAAALGALLSEGIGDTVRVSLAADPVEEVHLAREILVSLGLAARRGVELVVCPTCGRCEVDLTKLARQVKGAVRAVEKPVRLAVMGCIVNGPGEAADADIALCAGKGKAFLYVRGRRKAVVKEGEMLSAVLGELERF